MTIIYKYDRKDFFGDSMVYTEDSMNTENPERAKKAIEKALKSLDTKSAIGIISGSVNIIIYMEYADINNDVVNVKFYDSDYSYSVSKKSIKWIKDYCKELIKGM